MFGKLPYRDRTEAGQTLAERLDQYRNRSDVIVLALPRGGVPVASQVATRLEAPLDVFISESWAFPDRRNSLSALSRAEE